MALLPFLALTNDLAREQNTQTAGTAKSSVA